MRKARDRYKDGSSAIGASHSLYTLHVPTIIVTFRWQRLSLVKWSSAFHLCSRSPCTLFRACDRHFSVLLPPSPRKESIRRQWRGWWLQFAGWSWWTHLPLHHLARHPNDHISMSQRPATAVTTCSTSCWTLQASMHRCWVDTLQNTNSPHCLIAFTLNFVEWVIGDHNRPTDFFVFSLHYIAFSSISILLCTLCCVWCLVRWEMHDTTF